MSLQDLPPELIGSIVVLLPLQDVCVLRLAGKQMASKATQKHFKAKFRTKHLEVTKSRLHLFRSLAESDGLVSLLKDLTLIEPVYNTHELEALLKDNMTDTAVLDDDGRFVEMGDKELTADELHSVERDLEVLRQKRKEQLEFQQCGEAVELLSQAFINLAKHGTKLHRIQTEVVVYRDDAVTQLMPLYGGSWKYIWSAAASLTSLLFSSLAISGLFTETLNLFNSSRMQRCSLSCNELSTVDYSSTGLRKSLARLEALSLNISDKVIVRSDKDKERSEDNRSPYDLSQRQGYRPKEEVLEEAKQEINFAGLLSLLETNNQLKELNLLRYTLHYVDNEVTHAHCRGILGALENASLPMLQKLTLQGFDITEHQLLSTLQAHRSLKTVSLRYIHLLEGSFHPILDYCTLEASIEEVELDSLFEPEIVIFENSRAPRTDATGAQPVCYPNAHYQWSRNRPNGAADFRIKYHLRHGRTMDTPTIRNWRQDLKNRLGPPRYGKPSCVRNHLRPEETWRVW